MRSADRPDPTPRADEGALLRAILDGLPDAVFAVDEHGAILVANRASQAMLGLPVQSLIGHRVLHPSLRWADEGGGSVPRGGDPIRRAIAVPNPTSLHLQFSREDGRPPTHVRVRVTPTGRADHDPAAVVTMTDMTDTVHQHRAAAAETAVERHRSLYDPLTGLPNKPMLLDRIAHARERAWRSATATAMLVIDLDDFHAINDALGHEAGDEALVQVAVRLKSAMRATDTPSRIGSDDFVVLCEEISLADTDAQVATITQRVTRALDGPYLTSSGTTTVGASVGVAVADHPEHVHPGLIDQAEQAMHEAKRRRQATIGDLPTIIRSRDDGPSAGSATTSVVLVDPDDAMRLLTRRVLLGGAHPFDVVAEATSGRDAVQRILDLEPDLVICDLLLGDMHVSDLIREVRAQHPDQRFLLWATPQETDLPTHAESIKVPWLDKGQIEALADAAIEAAAAKLEAD